MRRLKVLASIIIFYIFASNVAADLIFDGVPAPIGKDVGNASASMMTGAAFFYESLGRWEQATTADGDLSEEERKANSEQSFKNSVSNFTTARDILGAILESSDEEASQFLEAEVSVPSKLDVGDTTITEVIKSFDAGPVPKTYRNVVELAYSATERLLSTFEDNGFSREVEEFRQSAAVINSEMSQVVLLGLAVGKYTVSE